MKQSSPTHGAAIFPGAPTSGWRTSVFSLALLALLLLSTLPATAADDSVSQKANQTVEETKKAIQGAGQATSDSIDELWRRIDEARLKNRSPDEIVAWALMGVLVGAVAAMLTSLKAAGRVGYLVSGLVGAFIGGIVVHLTRVDFGWGPVLIRYEELLFSFVGAILIVLILKFTGLKRFM
jgi:uncharacterized membrane protein YeaQ/YmgE (transglycosylase-associated protein family)